MSNEFDKENIGEGTSAEETVESREEFFGMEFSDGDTVSTDQKIDIKKTVSEAEKNSIKGVKIFCIILALAIAVSGMVTGAYYLGKNQVVNNQLASKPDGVTKGEGETVYADLYQSVVGIYVYNVNKKAFNASGIVYSADGYIITSDSIFLNVAAPQIKVVTPDGIEHNAEFIGGDQRSDIAVLKITDTASLKPAVLGNSDEVVIGEDIFALGMSNGYDEAAVLSEGIVSASNIRISNGITSYAEKRIQSNLSVNISSFGGALCNRYSQVIGMLSNKVISTDYEQTAYAVPTVEIKKIAEQIINEGKVADRARIGISYIVKNAAAAEIEKLPSAGLLVTDVDKESELYTQLKANDIITQLNGVPVEKDEDVLDFIDKAKPGDRITIKVVNIDKTEKECSTKLLTYKSESSYSDLPITEDNDLPEDLYGGY